MFPFRCGAVMSKSRGHGGGVEDSRAPEPELELPSPGLTHQRSLLHDDTISARQRRPGPFSRRTQLPPICRANGGAAIDISGDAAAWQPQKPAEGLVVHPK